jgi:photosystem II stability/assembly factor-like uncharacterized protein
MPGAGGAASAAAPPPAWRRSGPSPSTDGQVEGIADREVVGAVQAIAAHPENPDVLYVAAVNGGIWQTTNAMAARPSWTPLTDLQTSLSFGALEFDPTDAGRQTLVVGTGRFSSMRRTGGSLVGVLRSTDGGATWRTLGGATLSSLHITGVAARGDTIVISTTGTNAGIYRTTDTGATWTRISGGSGTGLPAGIAFDLAGDPTNGARLFTNAGANGLYRSTDTGATWSKVSSAAMDTLVSGSVNVRISVGRANNVYVVIAGSEGRVVGIFRSGNGGNTWAALDLPQTREASGNVFDLNPGGQAGIHLSIVADRDNENLVYVGGDRQPSFDETLPAGTAPRWPNSLGARDYSGRLFRIDASKSSGSQASHLTHTNTASASAPHADSRDMAIAANGVLLESDDGGVYRRTRPSANNGDWFSMNGDLQVTEFHSVAWDANCRTVVGGAQDTGSPQQKANSDIRWRSIATGDGGVVAVDAVSTAGRSTRYSSYQYLGVFRREVYDASGVRQSLTYVPLRVLGGGPPLSAQFYTPVELNRFRPRRLIIGADNAIYESDDQGDTITALSPVLRINEGGAIAYGAADNADILYVGVRRNVWIRTAAPPAALVRSAAYPATADVLGVALDPVNSQAAFAIDMQRVYRTANTGANWTDITNNLAALGATVFRSIAFCSGAVVLGTNNGVFICAGPAYTNWARLGTGLPPAPVLCLIYSEPDRVLLAGTLGRGAWTLDIPAPATT